MESQYVIVGLDAEGRSLGTLTHPVFGTWLFDTREEANEFIAETGVPPVPDGGRVAILTFGEAELLPPASY